MLEYLKIANLALIQDMELEFAPGLNVLTGETGAGKSFILKALNFLTGDKLAADLVRPGQEKARAEAIFVHNGAQPGLDAADEFQEIILRRELAAATGRSRVFVNDSLSSQDTVREMRPGLLVHTSQHGQQRLLQPVFQTAVLDGFLAPEARDLAARRETLIAGLRDVASRREALEARVRELSAQRDLYEYQLAEIDKVDPRPGEEEDLESRRRALRGAARAEEAADRALGLLSGPEPGVAGLVAMADMLARELEVLAEVAPDLADAKDPLGDARETLRDLEGRLRRISFSPPGDNVESIEARLFELAQLKRKLKRPLEEIIGLRDEIDEQVSFLDACGLDRKRLEREEAELAKDLATVLRDFNAARHAAADAMCAALSEELRGLGFDKDVRVEVAFHPHVLYERPAAPGASGSTASKAEEGDDEGCSAPSTVLAEDRPRILWVPNPGQPAQPLDRIASGGELSRFLLALVGLTTRDRSALLVFDEVDAGVGGLTLGHVGERLKKLSERQQVILITHWPQLAALADRHFHVRKDVVDGQTTTTCQVLDRTDIFTELSRMAGGGPQGEALARQLLGEG